MSNVGVSPFIPDFVPSLSFDQLSIPPPRYARCVRLYARLFNWVWSGRSEGKRGIRIRVSYTLKPILKSNQIRFKGGFRFFVGGRCTPTGARVVIACGTHGQFEAIAFLGLCQVFLRQLQRQGSNPLFVPNPTTFARRNFRCRRIRRRNGSLLLQARLLFHFFLIPLLLKSFILNVPLFVVIFASWYRPTTRPRNCCSFSYPSEHRHFVHSGLHDFCEPFFEMLLRPFCIPLEDHPYPSP